MMVIGGDGGAWLIGLGVVILVLSSVRRAAQPRDDETEFLMGLAVGAVDVVERTRGAG